MHLAPCDSPLESQTPLEIAAEFTDVGLDDIGPWPGLPAIDFTWADQIRESPSAAPFYPLDIWGQLELELSFSAAEPDFQVRGNAHERLLWLKSPVTPSFFASALIHITLLCVMAFFPAAPLRGNPGYTGNVIAVRIVPQEDLVPQDESPASVDSAASAPSRAKKVEKPWEQKISEPHKQPPKMHEAGPKPGKIVLADKPATPKEDKEQKRPEPEDSRKHTKNPEGDGPQDSVASIPSTASVERRFIPAAGNSGDAFESSVLSAIRKAIFFPRKALERRHHGEVVVAFTIKRDGSVPEVSITRPSGSTILDQAAIKIIEKAAKNFPPIPTEVNTETLNYVVPILFKEKKGS